MKNNTENNEVIEVKEEEVNNEKVTKVEVVKSKLINIGPKVKKGLKIAGAAVAGLALFMLGKKVGENNSYDCDDCEYIDDYVEETTDETQNEITEE